MISKTYRLNKRDIGKVLRKKKPFFSYRLIANTAIAHPSEKIDYPRFAIILSGKVTKGSVVRNFFRRRFYEAARPYIEHTRIEQKAPEHKTLESNTLVQKAPHNTALDIVVVAKKGTTLDSRSPSDIESFDSEIRELFSKIFSSK